MSSVTDTPPAPADAALNGSPLVHVSGSGRGGLLYGQMSGLLLAALESGPLYGAGMIDAIETQSEGMLRLTTAGVSQALQRLADRGLVSAPGPSARRDGRRRVYTLTTSGHAALAGHRAHWRQFVIAVDAVLDPPQ